MRSTPPPPPLAVRSSDEVLEELCLALRDVGVSTRFLPYRPPDPDIADEIARVRAADAELLRRGLDPTPRLAILTTETKWLMRELREECLRFPAVLPWVREAKDGIRIAMRCSACGIREFPEDSRTIRLCDGCLGVLDEALSSRTAREDLLLYRTYNREARCEHADDDTVLGVYPWSPEWSDDFPTGLCHFCVSRELSRRGEAR
jgi:hypothetical protein